MRADNTGPLIAAARNRHELTRAKAIWALRELDRAGTAITFEAVARRAGVSRAWLYSQPDLRADIERLREAAGRTRAAAVPAANGSTARSSAAPTSSGSSPTPQLCYACRAACSSKPTTSGKTATAVS